MAEPKKPLKISVAGVRGVVGETFTPDIVIRFSRAFATMLNAGGIAVCRDPRPSSDMVHSAVMAGLLASGAKPFDLGVCPVPTLEFTIAGDPRLAGGIAVSAGHNSLDWNALKFVRGDGIYLNDREAEELLDIFHLGRFLSAPWNKIQRVTTIDAPLAPHLERITAALGLAELDARLKIAVDAGGGACGRAAETIVRAAGCEPVMLNAEPGKEIPYSPEPSPRNMDTLATVVRVSGADAGLMFDTGGERLGIVAENGVPLSEETTIVLCALAILTDNPGGTIVANLCTTHALDALAERHGATVRRVPIGQAFVAEEAKKIGAVLAGEGSGGIVVPAVQAAQDSLAAAALIIRLLARSRKPLSALLRSLPKLHMIKKNIDMDFTTVFSTIERARKKIEANPKGAALDMSDGLKIIWKDAWLHIRASNTESIIRIIAEAATPKRAEKLIDQAEELLK